MIAPASAFHVATADGETVMWQPRADLVVHQASGVLSLPLAHLMVEFYEPIFDAGARIRIFDDFAAVTHHTREARDYLTVFTREHLFAIEMMHMLLGSKLLALGVSVFKHLVGDAYVRVYSDRRSWMSSYEAALREPHEPAPI